MKTVAFTDFRNKAASYFRAVEKGETVRVVRHGRPIADIVPFRGEDGLLSWKRPAVRLVIEGVSLCREILGERARAKR